LQQGEINMSMLAYLTLEGKSQGAIQGDCTTEGREDTIEVYAIDHTIEIPTDPNTGLATGTVLHRPISITKAKDKASPLLLQAVSTGETMSKWEMSFWQINKEGKQEEFYKITLGSATVVSLRQYKHHQLDEAYAKYKDMEDICFTYESISVEHVTAGKAAEVNWLKPNA